MMRFVASCLWICAVMGASTYVGAAWMAGPTSTTQTDRRMEELQHKKMAPINVPMISNGNVEGYVVAQFVYLIAAENLKQLAVPPDAFITDETFRALYSDQLDFNHIEKYDVPALTTSVIKKVNQRLGGEIIKDLLVEEFNYITRNEISK
jgi:hypothetical protein